MVEVTVPDIDVLLAYGHAEYLPPFPKGAAEQIWPLDDDDEFEVWLWSGQVDNDDLTAKWVEVTGQPVDRLPDVDLIWDHIYHVKCSRPAFEDAFEAFIVEMSAGPGGDDDTFDYWPSGARLLIAMGEVLGTDYSQRAFTMIRELILLNLSEWAGELLNKTGTWTEDDEEQQ